MKKLLIVYSKMVVGGSTTSLISLLNSIDYSKYSVDLLLYNNGGELQSSINKNVNILSSADGTLSKLGKMLRLDFWVSLALARYFSKKNKNRLINAQYMSKYEAVASAPLEKEYDVAISFLEFWPMEYIVRRVKAKKKIGWLHIDIAQAKLLKGVNTYVYEKLDKIVLVSDSCKKNMDDIYPKFSHKTVVIENLLSKDTIVNFSKEEGPVKLQGEPIFVSTCRIVLASKGLDRGVKAFARLKEDGVLKETTKWYIIGDGQDRSILEEMIKENGLEENIILLGQHKNPSAIQKDADFFLLPSRYEGKPMAVTEAQMLGLIPVVCEYSSAREQIKDGIDGIIAKNDDTDIYNKLKALLLGEFDLKAMKKSLAKTEFSNIEEIQKIYDLIEG